MSWIQGAVPRVPPRPALLTHLGIQHLPLTLTLWRVVSCVRSRSVVIYASASFKYSCQCIGSRVQFLLHHTSQKCTLNVDMFGLQVPNNTVKRIYHNVTHVGAHFSNKSIQTCLKRFAVRLQLSGHLNTITVHGRSCTGRHHHNGHILGAK